MIICVFFFSQDWTTVQELIEGLVQNFLVKHGLLEAPQKDQSSKAANGESAKIVGEDEEDDDDLDSGEDVEFSISQTFAASATNSDSDDSSSEQPFRISQERYERSQIPLVADDDEGALESDGQDDPSDSNNQMLGDEEPEVPLLRGTQKRRIVMLDLDEDEKDPHGDLQESSPPSKKFKHSSSEDSVTCLEEDQSLVLSPPTPNPPVPEVDDPQSENISRGVHREEVESLTPSEWLKKDEPQPSKLLGIARLKEFTSSRPPRPDSPSGSVQKKTPGAFRAVVDTSSGKTCYINSKTGHSFFSLPALSKFPRDEPESSEDEGGDNTSSQGSLPLSQQRTAQFQRPVSTLRSSDETSSAASVKDIIQQETEGHDHGAGGCETCSQVASGSGIGDTIESLFDV